MFREITLEMSLKPFKQTDEAYIRKICTQVFEQWKPLIKDRERLSILLWVGDGSELLDYAGRLEDPFEWARFVGTAALPYPKQAGPTDLSLHECKQDYIPHPPLMTYGILKTIVACLREEGERACKGATVRIGETFDIGPEFAMSDFRYRRHRECVSESSSCDGYGFLEVASLLHKDERPYAAYPHGIPEGTPFATFFAKQTSKFCADLGFDYLWLSNGLGFSTDPWKKNGQALRRRALLSRKAQRNQEKSV